MCCEYSVSTMVSECLTRSWLFGLTLILLSLSSLQRVPLSADAFNLDTRAPIIKRGSRDSYFGYSLAIHLRSDGIVRPVILVGAPRDNVTNPQAPLAVRKLVRPGAVYQCPVTSGIDDCEALDIDSEDPRIEEDKNGQWLGVSVVSQGSPYGKAVACAHLFRLTEPGKRVGIGQCITMANDLSEESLEQPCNGRRSMADDNTYAYAFCQAGTSSAIGKDGDILLGSPGTYSWRGSLFKRYLSGSSQDDNSWHQTPVEDSPEGHLGPKPATSYYSLLGMSSKIVYIIGQKWYIGGAPRSKFNGQVLMFRFINGRFHVEPEHVLSGQQIGSGFGYDFVVADFNGDRKEDLVVSAPFYHASLVGGAIYAYYHGPSGITSLTRPQVIYSRKMKELECTQLHCHDARFGLALTSLGDIDRDGYQDLAVGAPYEGNGAVYIFRGSSHGLHAEHSQRIAASQVFASPPISFGASLSAGFDLDNNGYPDLVVGAFASSAIAVLRARPVVYVTATATSTPERIDRKEVQCQNDRSANVCFEIKICLKFTAEPADWFQSRMNIVYQLDADKLSTAKPSRVVFSRTGAPLINGSLSMNPQSASAAKCDTQLVYIAKHTRDFMSPILLLLTYNLTDPGSPSIRPGEPITSINDYAIINEAAGHLNISVPFAMNCGDDHLCNSNITIKPYLTLDRDNRTQRYLLRTEQSSEMILVIPVINTGEDAHQAVLTIILPESLDYVETIAEGPGKQTCTPAEDALYCTVGNPLLGGQRTSVAVRLDARRVLPSAEQLDISLRVNTTSLNMNVDGSMANVSLMVLFETDVAVRGSSKPEQVFFSGVVLGESAISGEEQIGTKIEFDFEVVNFGKVSVPNAVLVVKWPYEWKNSAASRQGKHVLYLLEEPRLIGDNEGYCHYEEDWVNPLSVKLLESPNDEAVKLPSTAKSNKRKAEDAAENRKKVRERRTVSTMNWIHEKSNRKSFTMDCDDTKVKCHRMECTLGELLSKDSITLHLAFRIWNHTFVEEFSDFGEVRIFSRAEVRLGSTSNIVQTNTQNDVLNLLLTAVPDISVQEHEGVPFWIIIIAVIIGVVLLSICIILLWKCGFFKRSRHSDEDGLVTHQATRSKIYKDDVYHD